MKTTWTRLAKAFCLLTLSLPAQSSGAAAQAVTLERLMSAPFPTEIVAAPVGDRLAWVLNDEGSRNIWVAEGPSFEARRLTALDGDDGREVGGLQFTPDGESLLFVYGGQPNRAGEAPNPVSYTDPPPRGALWMIPLSGGEGRLVAEGGSPAISPDGSSLAFTRQGSIWTISLDEEGAEEERWADPRGGPGTLRWSPTGDRLAFASSRGDHGFIGVLTPGSGRIQWLDPTVDRDGSPAWSPDGTRVAFIRRPNLSGTLPFMPVRDAHPWEIRVADPASGTSRGVWKANEGAGSVFQGVNAANQLIWGAGDHLVFPWEGNGFKTLYTVPADGGQARPLSDGEYEVQFVSVAPGAGHVLFSSNQGDVDRQHVWRAAVDGSGAEQLTPGAGIEWLPVQTPGSGTVAFLASAGTVPAHPEVLDDGGRRWLGEDLYPADWPGDALVEPMQVVFPSTDGMMIHGQLFLPPGRCCWDSTTGGTTTTRMR
jgi:Tol biopolymer transport system component